MNGWMNRWMYERTVETDGPTDERTGGQTDERMDGWTDGRNGMQWNGHMECQCGAMEICTFKKVFWCV